MSMWSGSVTRMKDGAGREMVLICGCHKHGISRRVLFHLLSASSHTVHAYLMHSSDVLT